MLRHEEITRIRSELDNCKRPLFFFHDDADGLSSFLLFYRHKKEGRGVVVKTHPKMDSRFARKVAEYQADKVFILDIPIVEQNFFDEVAGLNVPMIWIDHHNPQDVQHALCFNPRRKNPKDDTCVTRICYEVVKSDLWIAMVGSVGDWQKPAYWDSFVSEYPDLIGKEMSRPEQAMFSSRFGELVKVFSFVLKGKTEDVVNCMKVLTRIESPYEILEQTTPSGKFLFKRYGKIKEYYDNLLKSAMHRVTNDRLFVFIYKGERYSFSSELSNEIVYYHPSKTILVGREKSGEIKYSIRSIRFNLPNVIKTALSGVDGYGGGHEHACGACVKAKDNDLFIKQFREAMKPGPNQHHQSKQ